MAELPKPKRPIYPNTLRGTMHERATAYDQSMTEYVNVLEKWADDQEAYRIVAELKRDEFRFQLVEMGGGSHCSCCRKCGPTAPCDESLLTDSCAGSCFCGVEG